MEEFTEEYSRILQSKEWLVKVDNSHSVPYLLKFGSSDQTDTCFLLITDTKTVWTEVLSRSQLTRRWRQCNPPFKSSDSGNLFSSLQAILRDLHTPGGISDSNFDIVESRDADLAFELDCDKFKWRWDTYLLGPKTSADIISKHLILPLISLAHVSFYSADPVSELAEADLEKTVDKIGRTARRSIDIHVKQTLSRPRIATALQRISSLLGLVQTLPPITSEAETPDLEGRLEALNAHLTTSSDEASRPSFATREDGRQNEGVQDIVPPDPVEPSTHARPAADTDSATESDSDGEQGIVASRSRASRDSPPGPIEISHANPASEPPVSLPSSRPQSSQSDAPPAKRARGEVANVSDSDSDSGTRGRSQDSQGTSSGTRNIVGRGVRQPLKRGGRRF